MTIRFSAELLASLRAAVARYGVPMEEIIRRALRRYCRLKAEGWDYVGNCPRPQCPTAGGEPVKLGRVASLMAKTMGAETVRLAVGKYLAEETAKPHPPQFVPDPKELALYNGGKHV